MRDYILQNMYKYHVLFVHVHVVIYTSLKISIVAQVLQISVFYKAEKKSEQVE